jgi:hypothetical protein
LDFACEAALAGLAPKSGMKERRMRHRDVVGYEADSQPVETVRGEFEAKDRCGPIRQGARDAVRRWPQGRSFRSSVIVVERLDVAGATQAADWGL